VRSAIQLRATFSPSNTSCWSEGDRLSNVTSNWPSAAVPETVYPVGTSSGTSLGLQPIARSPMALGASRIAGFTTSTANRSRLTSAP
jgi:hypothetical protein